MAFDQPTRNRLNSFVGEARALLTEEFARQLQSDYGIDPATGRVDDVAGIVHLNDRQRETGRILRDTLHHYTAGKQDKKARIAAIDRIVREQAFTVLNRLAALRMAEARGLLIPSIAEGVRSDGFQLYQQLAGVALGETDEAYIAYLFSLFDEFAVDLPVLFDRFSPEGRLFPSVHVLRQLLALINDEEIASLWAEDETIGWIYQYFNSREERQQMRQASSAPRNSRELAVRNQFFTPRYVVEFLTDNTLGRIWYEMTKGQTRLVDQCRYLVRRPIEVFLEPGETAPAQERGDELPQEELLQKPVYIPHRPLKDPRDIKMLDPACGSMHFGLYAFDLFETVYEEAWEMEVLGKWARDYRDKADFMRDVPRLIVERNIHGIDIDPRAVQIAGLSLWLRAQRSWQAQRVPAAERPTIARSNVVVAEPMPGDEKELERFLAAQFENTVQDQLVAGLMRRVFEAMKLAGEAGLLLRIDQEIADELADMQEKWTAQPKARQTSLFEQPKQTSLSMDMSPVSDGGFWEQIEGRIYTALQQFAEQREQDSSYIRRLFAQDAARGFAFIDLCRQRYDVALMNPPFGAPTKATRNRFAATYPDSASNLFCMFTLCLSEVCNRDGLFASITDRTWLQKTSYEALRNIFTSPGWQLRLLADLGWDVLDEAQVAVSLHVFGYADSSKRLSSIDVRQEPDRAKAQLLTRFADNCSEIPLSTFSMFPDNAIAHWSPKSLQRLFMRELPLDDGYGKAKRGISAGNTTLGYRLEWEVAAEEKQPGARWSYLQNGGSYSPFFRDTYLVCWSEDNLSVLQPLPGARLQNLRYVGRRGLTWAKRTPFLAPSILPEQHYFTDEGSAIFADDDTTLWMLLAVLNTIPMQFAINLFCGQHKSNGYVGKLPIPTLSTEAKKQLVVIARDLFELARSVTARYEPGTLFVAAITVDPDIPQYSSLIDAIRSDFSAEVVVSSRMRELHNEVDNLLLSVLEINDDEKLEIAGALRDRPFASPTLYTFLAKEEKNYVSQKTEVILGYLIGTVFGRWDIRYATAEKEPPPLPDPFDPLPVCPPGMLQNREGLPASPEDVPSDYPLRISWSGILVDDDGHREDIVGRVVEALRVIWRERADDIEAEVCSLLGVDSLRDYFGNPDRFFDDHLSRYSKSRRYAPIYWPLTTTNGSYTLWLYYHRLDASTLYQCVNDFVDPKLNDMQRRLSGLRNRQRTSGEEDQFEQLTNLAVELETFRNDLLELARFWRPNLNDGVEITAAPLYALFGHRNWRNRLEGTWGKLQEGEYDWAHLAMSIWPSRVVPKCVEDRSLAIAHDIEKLFWVEEDESWRPLGSPAEEETHQVEIRHSEELDRLRELFAELAEGEGRYLPAMQVWQSLDEGQWDHRPLGLHLYPERAAGAAFDDATRVYPHLAQRGQKLLQKDTKKNRQLLAKLLVERGTPELIAAVEATLAEETSDFATLWQALEKGRRDDLPLALALWPERVVGKALRDPKLAIKQGLFDFFWYDEPETGVRRRQPIDREIAREVQRRGGDKL